MVNQPIQEAELERMRERIAQLERQRDELEKEARARAEQRYRTLLDSTDEGVYGVDLQDRCTLINQAALTMLGYTMEEVLGQEMHSLVHHHRPDGSPYSADDCLLHRTLQTQQNYHLEDEVFWRKDGTAIPVECSSSPILEGGALRGAVIAFCNISERKRVERLQAAQHAVTRVLAEAATLDEATPLILEAISSSVGWQVGAIWNVDKQANMLTCIDVWHAPGTSCEEFEEATRGQSFGPGLGLPGRAWQTGKPVWIADVAQDGNFPRSSVASRARLHGAFAFPILFEGEVTGVLEFFSRTMQSPGSELLSMLGAMGSQIGQFLSRKQAIEEVRSSRERFELAMEGSGAGIWDWNVRTGEVYFSPQWKRMLGYEPDAFPSNLFEEWEKRLHPDDRERAEATLDAYMQGKTPIYELEHRLQHVDGSYRWILARGVALRDGQGKPYRLAGSHTDITARKRAEEALRDSEALYHSLVETLPLHVIRKDRQGRFIFANQRVLALMGRSLTEIVGKTDSAFYPPELAAKYRHDDERVIQTGEVFEDVEEHRKANGERIYVQVLKAPVYDSRADIVGSELIFWDVTARKLAEEGLQQAKEAAEAANRAKSQFLANMSHEIRTPMNAIMGMTDLVLETQLNADQRDCLETVKKSAESLLGIINDILDFSKIEAGKLELDRHNFNLRDSLGDTLSTLALRADQKGIELVCRIAGEVPENLIGDSGRLRQVLVNLIGNAIKFTEKGEIVVTVEAASTKKADGEAETRTCATKAGHEPALISLHFAVRDTGIGIAPDKLTHIFEPFVQADGSTTRRYGGTGLGLAISARLVEVMGGRIEAESQVGMGSTFHFAADFVLQPEPIEPRLPVDASQLRGLAVLIVDDNATNRRILEETLLHWQLRPTLVGTGRAALEVLHKASRAGEPYPLVLLDSHMPDMPGFSLAEQIKQHPELAGAAIMMLTSSDHPDEARRSRELKIGAYLTKPVKQADLWHALLTAVNTGAAPTSAPPTRAAAVGSATAAAPDGVAPSNLRPLRILLVEDNLVNQKLAVRLLQKREHDVVVANHGREALAILEASKAGAADGSFPFDLILMDVQMPEMDGYETTGWIREQERHQGRHLPIIAMTAYAMKGDRERCLEAGMDGYISKPIRAQELFDIIGSLALPSQPVPAPPAVPAEDALDWSTALEYVGGDHALLKDLIAVFLEECPRWLGEVRSAMTTQDLGQIQRAAHKLKGTLGNFGAHAAFKTALRLEEMCRGKASAGVPEAWNLLEKEIDRILPALAAWTREN